MRDESVLSPAERVTLTVVCDVFHPALVAEPGDDATLFAASASKLGVPAAAERAIALLSSAQRAELRQFLRLLASPIAGLLLLGVPRGMNQLNDDDRERFMLKLARSPVPQLRSGFQALKRLSSFLLYSISEPDATNPLWPVLGYAPSAQPPAAPAPLQLVTMDRDRTFEADVCIVGSGAGGGVAAAELAAKGWRVIVLEAGPGDQAPDFEQRELQGMQRLYLDNGLTATADLSVAILAGACLGGGTTVNWQTSLRTPEFVRDEWTQSSGSELFTSMRFTRALDAVMQRAGVSTDESAVNANNAPLRNGCQALDHEWATIARNSRGCDTTLCGYCTFGCRLGRKQSTMVTFLQDAQRQGDTTIIASCKAQRVTMERGAVTGVDAEARTGDGRAMSVRINAPRVVVAAGGIQSPVLLLRSGLRLPHLGCNLLLHPTTAIAGLYAEPVHSWSGPPQTIVSSQFARIDGNYGFRLEAAPVHPGLLALAVPWTGARRHRELMQRAGHASSLIALVRDSASGRVQVRRDGSTRIDYSPGHAEQTLIARGITEAVRIHIAAGAEEVLTLHNRGMSVKRGADVEEFCRRVAAEPVAKNRSALFSAHQMATCRIGSDARAAVCDERGEVFGVRGLYVADASAFPGSSGVNPMITVMALAKCVAEGIV